VALGNDDIHGSELEAPFDDLSELAAQIAGTPISQVNIVGDTNVWLKVGRGVPPGPADMPPKFLRRYRTPGGWNGGADSRIGAGPL
jgi:hypothetical protein